MESPTFLTDHAAPAVIDTSTAINLIATGYAAEILKALPNRVLAVDAIPAELEEGRRRGRKDADLLKELMAVRLVEIVTLNDGATEIFEQLVIGPAAMTLDDGEAATIAYALEYGGIAIIDERKATRICAGRFPTLGTGCTVDLLAHPHVVHALGRERLTEAVLSALRLARMRVLPHHIGWVVELIGTDEAASCVSLPRSIRQTENRKNQKA